MPGVDYAPLASYTPTWEMLENSWRLESCKVQMHHLLGMPVGQTLIFSPVKRLIKRLGI